MPSCFYCVGLDDSLGINSHCIQVFSRRQLHWRGKNMQCNDIVNNRKERRERRGKRGKYQEHGYSCLSRKKITVKISFFFFFSLNPIFSFFSHEIFFFPNRILVNIKMWKWDAFWRKSRESSETMGKRKRFETFDAFSFLETHSHTRRFQFMSLFDNSIFVQQKQRKKKMEESLGVKVWDALVSAFSFISSLFPSSPLPFIPLENFVLRKRKLYVL